jgi:hypothetical protein
MPSQRRPLFLNDLGPGDMPQPQSEICVNT